MSFIRKNWWKFALGFAALILVAFGILWGLGIKNGNISVDDSGVNIKVGNQESISKVFVDEKNLKEFKSVKIKSPSDDISFIPSDCYGLEICEPDYFDEPTWSVENEQLEIQTSNNKSNFGSVKSEKRYINIYYPKNSSFENILIDASSGDINIPDAKAKKLDVSVASGDINATISDCGEILARNTSGDINIKNAGEISTTIDTETVSGNIKLDGKAWNLLKAKSTSGNVKIIGKLNGQSTGLQRRYFQLFI